MNWTRVLSVLHLYCRQTMGGASSTTCCESTLCCDARGKQKSSGVITEQFDAATLRRDTSLPSSELVERMGNEQALCCDGDARQWTRLDFHLIPPPPQNRLDSMFTERWKREVQDKVTMDKVRQETVELQKRCDAMVTEVQNAERERDTEKEIEQAMQTLLKQHIEEKEQALAQGEAELAEAMAAADAAAKTHSEKEDALARRAQFLVLRFLPPYDGPDAPQGKQLFLDQELNDFYHKTFQYYDADQSGTISDYAEMRKLTINLSWSLVGTSRLKGSRLTEIDNKLDYFKDPYLNRNPMYLPVYVVWFSRHIMDPYYEFETPDDDEDDSDSDEEMSLRKKDIKMLYHWESTEQEIEPRRAPTPEAAPENPKNLAHAKVFQAPMPPPPPPPRSPSIGSPANLSNPLQFLSNLRGDCCIQREAELAETRVAADAAAKAHSKKEDALARRDEEIAAISEAKAELESDLRMMRKTAAENEDSAEAEAEQAAAELALLRKLVIELQSTIEVRKLLEAHGTNPNAVIPG